MEEVTPSTWRRAEGHSSGGGGLVIAWLVTLGLVLFIIALQDRRGGEAGASPLDEKANAVVLELQARYVVGIGVLAGDGSRDVLRAELAKSWATLAASDDRLRTAVVAGELAGPSAALERLTGAEGGGGELGVILGELYTDYMHGRWAAPSVDAAAREELVRQLGWFGSLALAPAETPDAELRSRVLGAARRTALISTSTVTAMALLGLMGLVLLFPTVRRLASGRVGTRVPVSPDGRATPYAETFALWLAATLAVGFLAAFATTPGWRLAIGGSATLVGLAALAWLPLRGQDWASVRRAVGLTRGRAVLREVGFGLGTYVASLPLVAIGQVMTFYLARGAAEDGRGVAANPIVGLLASSDPALVALMLVLACVVAPVAEEIVFRGVLHHHLRSVTARLGWGWSFVVSAFVSSVLFAAIHPQGLLAVPALTAIALALVTARELRGSLIAPIVAHALNNGVLVIALVLALGGGR